MTAQRRNASMQFVGSATAASIEAELRHPPATAMAAELDQLRLQAQLLFRSYGPCPYRVQELARIQARMRQLRNLLRGALGASEGQGMVRGPFAPGALRPAWTTRMYEW